MSRASQPITVINMNERWTDCHICGEPTLAKWGVPTWNGSIVANDWPGDWGGVPACEKCWEEHERGLHVEEPTPTTPKEIAWLVAQKRSSRQLRGKGDTP